MDSDKNLTTEQVLALRTDRHISVTANAGSGKTMVLVERFRKIINENIVNSESDLKNPLRIDPSRILAITFTRKAAGEMQKKIVNKFNEEYLTLLRAPKKDYSMLNTLKRIREGLSYANISTIHGFCSGLLRNYPIEGDVPVNFIELSAPENLHLISDCFQSTLEDWLDEGKDKNDHFVKIKTLLKYFSRKNLMEAVSIVIDKAEVHKTMQLFYNKPNEEIKHESLEYVKNILEFESIQTTFENLFSFLREGSFFKQDKKNSSNEIKTNLITAYSNFETMQKNISTNNEIEDLLAIVISYLDVIDILFTKSNKVRASVAKVIFEPNYTILEELYEHIKNIKKLKDSLESFAYFDQTILISRYLWEFVNDVYKLFDQEKKEGNRLDFNDLQLKALNLLNNSEVVSKVRDQFDYIMIDEFQDTNDLQYDIIKALVPELIFNGENSGINLFIVGDTKQSIYGFRNADVRVFNKAINDIVELNKTLINEGIIRLEPAKPLYQDRIIDETEFLGKNKLTSTFRLLPVPAAFINIVFNHLMSVGYSDYDVSYSDLVCSRDIDKLEIADTEIKINNNSGKVGFILAQKIEKEEDESNDDDNSESRENEFYEEKNIAKYIKSILGTPLSTKPNQTITFRDIAILCHKKTNFNKLSKILHEEKIPHIINGGQGFYNTEEIDDIINVMRFVYNPNDDMSFVAVMRSPYMNYNDSDIFKILKSSEKGTLWEKFKEIAKNQRWSKVNLFFHKLEDIQNYSVSHPITTVIYKILESFGWIGKISYSPAKIQKQANLEKFIDMAREYEALGYKNIFDFIEEIDFIAANSIREGEATVITDENAINILTIHSAKGLQFPVVILYNTNSGSGGKNIMSVTREFGIGFQINSPDELIFDNKVNTPFEILNKLLQSKIEEAEAKRVLYVAMTRAEEILMISGLVEKNINNEYKLPRSFLRMICHSLTISIGDIITNGFEQETLLGIRRNNKFERKKILISAHNISEFSEEHKADDDSKMESEAISLTDDVKAKQVNEYFSPSKIMTYNHSNEDYLYRYILGFTDDENELIYDAISADEELTGIYPGKVIHSVLEKINLWLDTDRKIDEIKLQTIICSELLAESFSEQNKLHMRIFSECIMISKTKLINTEIASLRNADFEKRLTMPLAEDFISGIIDVLIRTTNGVYEIWDWKTNLINGINDSNELAQNYEIQMMIYAYLVSKLVPEQDIYIARLLFTRLANPDADNSAWTHEFRWSRIDLEKSYHEFSNKINEIRSNLYCWL